MEWRKIPSTAGYEASDDGQIRSPDIEQTLQGRGGSVYTRKRSGRVLSQGSHSAGYKSCTVITLDGKQSSRTVHSLVMEAFAGPADGMWINHKNGIKTDNRLENLEYCSASDNQRHAIATGLAPKPPVKRGVEQHKARLSEIEVRRIRAYAKLNWSGKAIADFFGVGDTTVFNILKGNSWAWLPDD